MRRTLISLSLLALIVTPHLAALPMLERPYPLPSTFAEIITIYPDNDNTNAVRRYWLVPSTARIMRRQNGKLAFGLVHSGVSSFDPDGVNALVNVTIQPYVDEDTLKKAKKLVEDAARQEGATSVSFNYIVPTETTARLLVGGQFYDWNGKELTIVKGGSVEAGIPFQVKLSGSNHFDVRALTQAGGADAALFGVMYTMKFNGVGDRVHFEVRANFKEVYEHFKATVSASGWFGLVSASASTEWQTLRQNNLVKLTVWEGTQELVDKYYGKDILEALMRQLTERTGFFATRLKPNGLPGSSGGSGLFGWGFSASGGFEKYDEDRELVYEVDAQFTRPQEIAFGMNFPTGGDELATYVKNLTDQNKPYPSSDDYKAIAAQHKACRTANLASLKKMLDDGTIDKELHAQFVKTAIEKGCFVDYTTSGAPALWLSTQAVASATGSTKTEKLVPGSNVPMELLLQMPLTQSVKANAKNSQKQ